jgi:hydrogenase-4 transcriptional activator
MQYPTSSGWGQVSGFSANQAPKQASCPSSSTGEVISQNKHVVEAIAALAELTCLAGLPPFIVNSCAMFELIQAIQGVRNSRAPMLITGETGTGKELLSRAVHALSDRHSHAFLAFNCAASNYELIESQLFGHVRGSFTGASGDAKGVIRAAEGGTLLLDEFGELSLDVQPKLLRFLQEREVHPVGAARPIKVDVRVIAATNRDLQKEVREGRFRADLFERLNVLRLHVPRLCERREEVPHLLTHFLDFYQQQERKHGLRLSDEAMALLLAYDWPRNVRQLANEVFQLVVMAKNDTVIGADRLSPEVRAGAAPASAASSAIVGANAVIDLNLPLHNAMDEMERLFVVHALEQTHGNLSQAAARLKMSRNGLKKAIRKFGIEIDKGAPQPAS